MSPQHQSYTPEHVQRTRAQRLQLLTTAGLQMAMLGTCVFLVFALCAEDMFPTLWKKAFALFAVAITFYIMALGDLLRVNARMVQRIWDAFGEQACTVCAAKEELRADRLPEDKK